MSSAPVRAQAPAIASTVAARIGRTPPSPWIGSTMIAAGRVVNERRRATPDRWRRANDTPGISGCERRAVVLVPGHRQRAHGAAMERVRERDVTSCAIVSPRVCQ